MTTRPTAATASVARDVADRIIFMDGGVIVEQGDAKEVINNPQHERTKRFLAGYNRQITV